MQLVDAVPETPVHTATRFRPAGMFASVLAGAAASITYRLAGVNWFGSPLSLKSHLGFSVMLAFVVVGVYQFYFWIQQNDHFARRHSLRIALDDSIPFVPHWVWIYGILYYAMFVSLLLLPQLGPASLLFAAGIALSSLFCKQQLVVDVPAGLLLGWAAWKVTVIALL